MLLSEIIKGIVIPDTSGYRAAPGRLKGLRCIHTHLNNEPLPKDDLTDLALLRLDIMAAITIEKTAIFDKVHVGHILPKVHMSESVPASKPLNPNQLDIGCLDLIQSLEAELAHITSLHEADTGKERALLVSVTTSSRSNGKDSMAELEDLGCIQWH